MKNQNGFTLIELVVVIVILGILAAVAVPKFVDIQEDARIATVSGAAAALNSGVALAHAKWLVTGSDSTSEIIIVGTTDVAFNGLGWPVGEGDADGAVAGPADCAELWDDLMESNAMGASATAGAEKFDASNATTTCYFDLGGISTSGYRIVYDSTDGQVTIP